MKHKKTGKNTIKIYQPPNIFHQFYVSKYVTYHIRRDYLSVTFNYILAAKKQTYFPS